MLPRGKRHGRGVLPPLHAQPAISGTCTGIYKASRGESLRDRPGSPRESREDREKEKEKENQERKKDNAALSADRRRFSGSAEPYAFEAGVIRLKAKDLEAWRKDYPNLSLEAELRSLSEWAGRPENAKGWFHAVQGGLAKRNRKSALAVERVKEHDEKYRYIFNNWPRRKTNPLRAFSASGWRWLMPRLGVARGAVMVRGAEVLRWQTGVAACMAGQARGRARPKVWSGRVGADGSTGTTRPRRSECGEMHASSIACFDS